MSAKKQVKKTIRKKKQPTREELKKLTKQDMQEIRSEDIVALRKKAETLLALSKKDLDVIISTKKKFNEQLRILELQEIKSNGAIKVLEMLLDK